MLSDIEFFLPGMKVTRFSIKKGDRIDKQSKIASGETT